MLYTFIKQVFKKPDNRFQHWL